MSQQPHAFSIECFVHRLPALVLLTAAIVAVPAPVRAQQQARCESEDAFTWLDFWVGDWDVFVDGERAGQNRIQKIVAGCAITEDWTSASGQRGHSLFYLRPISRTWRQVWVTDNALATGGLKEKELIARLPNGGVRFQGEIPLAGGGTYADRTTLTPSGPDEVRQVIEVSTDGGREWRVVFDGRYVRRP